MEKTFKINRIIGGFEAILRSTGNVVAQYNNLGEPTKILDGFNLPVQEYIEAYAVSANNFVFRK